MDWLLWDDFYSRVKAYGSSLSLFVSGRLKTLGEI